MGAGDTGRGSSVSWIEAHPLRPSDPMRHSHPMRLGTGLTRGVPAPVPRSSFPPIDLGIAPSPDGNEER